MAGQHMVDKSQVHTIQTKILVEVLAVVELRPLLVLLWLPLVQRQMDLSLHHHQITIW